MADKKTGKRKKSWKISFGISGLIHLALAIVLFLVGFWFYQEKIANRNSANSSGGDTRSFVPDFDPQEVASKAKAAMDKAVKDTATSGAEKLEEVKKKMSETVDKMSTPDVKAAVSTAEKFQDIDNSRAYEPRENVPGKFDPNTATIYDIKKISSAGGDEVLYRYTLVDAKGRSMQTDVPLERMSKNDLNTYRLFKMARNNDKFKAILKSAIKTAESKLAEDQAQ